MKFFFRYVLTDLRRCVRGGLWCAGIIGVTFFLFFSLENMGILNDNVVSAYLFSTNMSGVLISFVFCALPYATVFSEDQEHKYVLYSAVRGELKTYVWAKAAVIHLSSVLVMLGGSLLFLLLCRTQAPWMDWEKDSYGAALEGGYAHLLREGRPFLYCMISSLHLGLLAGVLSLLSAFCSIYLSNKVLVLLLPFLFMILLSGMDMGIFSVRMYFAVSAVFSRDWQNLLFVLLLSLGPSVLITAGIYEALEKRL